MKYAIYPDESDYLLVYSYQLKPEMIEVVRQYAKARDLKIYCIGQNFQWCDKQIPSGEVWGGVPAHYLMTTHEYAEKCLANTPPYDYENYRYNFKEEVLRICDTINKQQSSEMSHKEF